MVLVMRSGDISKVHQWVNQRLENGMVDLNHIVNQFNDDTFQISQDTKGIRITLQNPNMFDVGKAEPLPVFRSQLKKISQAISKLNILHLHNIPTYKQYLKEFDEFGFQWNVEIRIEGHTDNTPLIPGSDYRNNWELSAARAQSIMRVLQKESELPQSQFAVAGYGEYRPIADNSHEVGRELNRRVEIFINASLVEKQ